MPLSDDLKDLIEHDRETARRLLLDLASALPGSADTQLLLAGSYLRSLELPEAGEAYRRVLQLDPAHNAALHGLGFCHLAQGDEAGALDAYRQAAALTSSANSMNMTGLLLHRLGRLEEAARVYQTVLTGVQDGSVELFHALRGAMAVMREAGRTGAADQLAERLIGRFQALPLAVSSYLVERSQAIAFHEWRELVDKAGLARSLQKALKSNPRGVRVPDTFILPDQREELVRFAADAPAGTLFIAKPTRGSGGQGISVISDLTDVLDRNDVIVQRYVERPYLVDGRKGHLRIYVLISSAEPLRAHIYSEGIVRFAPAVYDPRPERLAEVAMHVTNTALHLDHPDLVVSQDPSQEDVGMIWSLSALFRRMQADGHDTGAVFGEIQTLVAWFLGHLRDEGFFARQTGHGAPRSYAPKLFGLDILLDADGHPWLLEIQTSPAATGAALVTRINGELFKTIFRMAIAPLALGETADPDAITRRELEIELANRGLFTPLDLSP